MSDKPLVTVVIPFFNAEQFIRETIESVLAQTYGNWELLLVDDGSTDGSLDLAVDYSRHYPGRVKYLQHDGQENRGLSASRNLGVSAGRGEFVAFLDADDVWLPQKLQEQVTVLISNPEAAMVYGPAELWHSWTGQPEDFSLDRIQELGILPDRLVEPPVLLANILKHEASSPSMCSILVRNQVFEEVGGFDETFRGMYEDQAFLSKILVNWPVYVSSHATCKYRQHQDSMVMRALKTGQHAGARVNFLKWLTSYLRKQQLGNRETWRELRRQLWRWRLLSAFPFTERTMDRVGQVKIFLVWVRLHLKPALLAVRS